DQMRGPRHRRGARARAALCFFDAALGAVVYTLSLHDALPISRSSSLNHHVDVDSAGYGGAHAGCLRKTPIATHERREQADRSRTDRKSTRLNSSHRTISYAVFCLKKTSETAAGHVVQADAVRG